jgi:hypothetical protein
MPSKKSAWIDVTIPFANGMHTWPGNPPTVIKPHASLAKGDDIHATVLHLLGLDHEKLTFRHNGANRRLTDVHGHVIKEIVA